MPLLKAVEQGQGGPIILGNGNFIHLLRCGEHHLALAIEVVDFVDVRLCCATELKIKQLKLSRQPRVETDVGPVVV